MIKTLTRVGNSLALIIDRPVLDVLGIDRDTPLEIRAEDGGLRITPVRPDSEHKARVREAARRMTEAHRETLAKLAR